MGAQRPKGPASMLRNTDQRRRQWLLRRSSTEVHPEGQWALGPYGCDVWLQDLFSQVLVSSAPLNAMLLSELRGPVRPASQTSVPSLTTLQLHGAFPSVPQEPRVFSCSQLCPRLPCSHSSGVPLNASSPKRPLLSPRVTYAHTCSTPHHTEASHSW